MDMFDRLKDNPLLTDYFDCSKEKIIGKSSKFVYDTGKIHLYITGEIGLDLHNLLHESIHYALAKSSLFIQAKDLLLTFDFISSFTEDLNLLPFRAKNDQIEFALDLLSGDRPFRCKRYKELCLVYFTYHKLFVRSKILQRNAIICNEGAATYCALHIQEYSKKSILDYLFNTLVPPKYVNDLYLAQKRLIKKINDLSADNPYRVGYQYAQELAKDFGIESVIIATMLSNYVPFYNFDLLHDDEIFESRANYLYNADERFKYLLSLSPTEKK